MAGLGEGVPQGEVGDAPIAVRGASLVGQPPPAPAQPVRPPPPAAAAVAGPAIRDVQRGVQRHRRAEHVADSGRDPNP